MGIGELNSGYEDYSDGAKRLFPRVEHPQGGYRLDDLVAHVDGIAYRIREIHTNGRYVLGYTYQGRDVEIEASADEFRRMGDIVLEDFFDEVTAGNIRPDQIIQFELPHQPLDGSAADADMNDFHILWSSES